MKKLIGFWILFTITLFSISAQGFYFDIGLGTGYSIGSSSRFSLGIDENYLETNYTTYEIGDIHGFGLFDLGFKIGYGPNENLPIYFVATLGQYIYEIDFKYTSDYSSSSNAGSDYRTYIFGLGIIYYPIPLLQLSGSLGFSTVANSMGPITIRNNIDEHSLPVYGSKRGFAYELSLAIDLGRGYNGGLIGLKYFNSINTLENGAALMFHNFGIFARYVYRQRTT